MSQFLSDMTNVHLLELLKSNFSVHLPLVVVNGGRRELEFVLIIALQVTEGDGISHVVLKSEVLESLELLVGFFKEFIIHISLQLRRQLRFVQELLNLLVLQHSSLVRLVLLGRAVVPDDHIRIVCTCEGGHLGSPHLSIRVDRALEEGKLIVVHLDGEEIALKDLFIEHGGRVEFFISEQVTETLSEGSVRFKDQKTKKHVLFKKVMVKVHFHFKIHDFLKD